MSDQSDGTADAHHLPIYPDIVSTPSPPRHVRSMLSDTQNKNEKRRLSCMYVDDRYQRDQPPTATEALVGL